MTLNEAQQAIADATRICSQTVGSTPQVFARFSGGWSGDMTWALIPLGFKGVIPIDFAAGTGFGDEAKVLLETGGAQIEALTAKPIDASSDAAFLTFGTRLGESIDAGEISTALLAHWPGQSCDSFEDVRRVSTWSLCLGRFWNLENYFSEGEHPYHHGNIPAVSKSAASLLDSVIERGEVNPISKLAAHFCEVVGGEQMQIVAGLANLISGDKSSGDETSDGPLSDDDPIAAFADAVVGQAIAASPQQSNSTMLINSASIGRRETLRISHSLPAKAKHIFAVSHNGSNTEVTVDVPAYGFVTLNGQGSADLSSKSFGQRIRGALTGGRRSIASKERSDGTVRLQNEFMEVVISPSTGGIAGVYSGSIRGNRFSMKFVRVQSAVVGECSESVMECDSIGVGSSSQATGLVTVTGHLRHSDDKQPLAEFELEYRLDRGSRVLQVTGKLIPSAAIGGEPWLNYFAARAAVAGEAAIYRPLIRDKVHRGSSRRFVAPLGMVIDEAERQTLIGSCGLAFHRHVSDRFLDTLLAVQDESIHSFRLFYGFDVSSPVAMARSLIVPPTMIPITTSSEAASIGWIVYPSPKSVHVSSFRVERISDGRLAGFLRLTQTRSQPCKANVRFLRDVESAFQVDQSFDDLQSQPPKDSDDRKRLETKGDRVSVPMPSHGVVDLLIVFGDSGSA